VPCSWTGADTSPRLLGDPLETPSCKPRCSFALLSFRGDVGFYSAVPVVTGAGEDKLWVVGPPKVAPAKVHQAQLSGGNDE